MTLKIAYSQDAGVVTVMPTTAITPTVDVAAASDEDRRWRLRIESMAESAGISLEELSAIQAQSGLSWPAMELVIATLRITDYRRLYGG